MRICIKILLLLIISISVNAQEKYPDSLKQALKNASTDSARYIISSILATYYQEDKRDSALYYAEGALILAQKNNKQLEVASSFARKGYMLMHLGKLPESYQYFPAALKIAENPESENIIWSRDPTLTPRKQRLSVLENIHHDFGHFMSVIGKTDQQIVQYQETKKIAEEIGDTLMLGFVNMNLGNVYLNLGKLDSALILEENAARIFIQKGDERYLSHVYNLTGRLYLKKDNKLLAVQYFHKAIKSAVEQNSISILSDSYSSLTDFFLHKEKNKDSSLYYARKNLGILQSMGKKELGSAYSDLSTSYEQNNKIDSAYKFKSLALTNIDSSNNARIESLTKVQNLSFDEQLRLQELEKEKADTKNKITTYAMLAALAVFLAIGLILYSNNRQKQKANKVLETTLSNLKSTQSQLIQSEKMASLGELTAGIAHEIQNPLNFVNNFSGVNNELIEELKGERSRVKGERNETLEEDLLNDISDNSKKINQHGLRASNIVKGMLEHSRKSSGIKEPTDINALCEEYIKLSYQAVRAKDPKFNCEIKLDLDPTLPKVNVVASDISRVILNLVNNAFYATVVRNSESQESESLTSAFKPLVCITTKYIEKTNENFAPLRLCEISISDNGNGIPVNIKDKIYQPFFTTKPSGQGTGLGLSLAYDIIKAHGGTININSNNEARPDDPVGRGSTFQILLPI